jgi:hypothetical protein
MVLKQCIGAVKGVVKPSDVVTNVPVLMASLGLTFRFLQLLAATNARVISVNILFFMIFPFC